jgi:hypothetical protein
VLPEGFVTPYVLWPCPTVRLLALPFAGHPDLQEEWRPVTDLITWLRVAIDGREEETRKLLVEAQRVQLTHADPKYIGRSQPGWHAWPDAEALCDTALREVQAHRAIVDDYARAMERRKQHPDDMTSAGALLALHGVVKRVASIYSGRDGYREEWRP